MKTKKCGNYLSLNDKMNMVLLSDMQDSVYLAGDRNSLLMIDVHDSEWYLFDELFGKMLMNIKPDKYVMNEELENKENIQKFHDKYVTRLVIKSDDTDDYLVLAKMFEFYFLELYSNEKNKQPVVRMSTIDDKIGQDFLEFYHKLSMLDEKMHQITITEYVYSLKAKSVL